MKLELSLPQVNMICDAIKQLQQQAAVTLETIIAQGQAQLAPPAANGSAPPSAGPAMEPAGGGST